MDSQPASPDEMVGAAAGNDGPEARPVTEDPEMGQLVDDDRFERFRRRQDEPPREAQPALTRRASPAAALVADRHGGRGDVERGSVAGDLTLHEDAGTVPEPRLEDCGHWTAIRVGQPDDELVAIGSAFTGDAGSAGRARGGGGGGGGGIGPPRGVGPLAPPPPAPR